jgi:GntR family transcriptional repressor for pyruvate dehydrogenase complex
MQLIRSEEYQPGDRLPPIMEMAKRFGVGHPTLREALRKLEVIGMLEIRHGSGVYIKRDKDVMLVSNPVFGETATKELLLDLLETRMAIELKTTELAAGHADEEDLARMEELMQTAERNLNDDDLLSPANLQFHCEIAVASGNTVLAHVLEALMGLFSEEHRMILNIYRDRKKDHDEHVSILEALREHDAPLAQERMRVHLEGVRNVLQRWKN